MYLIGSIHHSIDHVDQYFDEGNVENDQRLNL